MKQYNVTGMSCAACSARVEKAVSKVPGVTECSVSLLTNSMGVEGDAVPKDVIAAVRAAGYGASLKGAAKVGRSGGRRGAAGGSRNAEAEAAAGLVAGFFAGADVFFNGTYDVGLAAARVLRGQPHRHGAYAAAAGCDRDGHQSDASSSAALRACGGARRTWTRWWRWALRRHSCTVPTRSLP